MVESVAVRASSAALLRRDARRGCLARTAPASSISCGQVRSFQPSWPSSQTGEPTSPYAERREAAWPRARRAWRRRSAGRRGRRSTARCRGPRRGSGSASTSVPGSVRSSQALKAIALLGGLAVYVAVMATRSHGWARSGSSTRSLRVTDLAGEAVVPAALGEALGEFLAAAEVAAVGDDHVAVGAGVGDLRRAVPAAVADRRPPRWHGGGRLGARPARGERGLAAPPCPRGRTRTTGTATGLVVAAVFFLTVVPGAARSR